jgi:outer membrane protein OmpA-like peptidoglycan-associated protein
VKIFPLFGACAVSVLTCTAGYSAPSLSLKFPGPAETTAAHTEDLASFRLAVGPFAQGKLAEQMTEGSLDQSAWRIAAPQVSTLQMMQSLRNQITEAGFQVIYECETEACGGFDFRFATEAMPEPDMHIDLGDFRYLAAQRPGKVTSEFIALLVSRSPQNSFVQLTRVGGSEPLVTSALSKPEIASADLKNVSLSQPAKPSVDMTGIGKDLDIGLPLVLEDLVFGSGSSDLQAADYACLNRLADWLQANPSKTVTLVGHTDASGGLASNVSLSKQRAESVRQNLLAKYNVKAAQITADGVGPLSPRSTNLTAEGRATNRRVEVLITPTQ